jgi:hypothetical protein
MLVLLNRKSRRSGRLKIATVILFETSLPVAMFGVLKAEARSARNTRCAQIVSEFITSGFVSTLCRCGAPKKKKFLPKICFATGYKGLKNGTSALLWQ